MNIDKAFIENLRDRISIVDTISKYIPLTRKGKEHWGCCPFHHEKTASFSVSDEKNFYHCFGCGAHGDVITFFMQHLHLSFIEAIEKICQDNGIEMPKSTPEQRARDKQSHDLYEVLKLATDFYKECLYSDEGKEGLAYLRKRGLSDEMIANFHLCYAPNGNKLIRYLENKHIPLKQILNSGLARISEKTGTPYDYFRNRVLFPITDSKGRIIAFGGRVMDDSLPKYLNSPESIIFSKGRNLYGLAQARVEAIEKNQVIATEGYMDTISLHKFGFKTAVAPLGTAITEMQIELLWKLSSEPILCFDSDTAGRKAGIRAALRVLPILRPGKSLKFCLIEGAKDPDEFLHSFGHDKFQEMLDTKCISLSDILWLYFTSDKVVQTPEQRAGLAEEIKKELSHIKNEAVRKFYTEDFNSRMRREFSRVKSAPPVTKVKANPENPNEKMILAFAITYPSLFFKFLEEGKKITLNNPVYKKIFNTVISELSVNPHTRETIMKFLEEKGFKPQILLKFEIDSLIKKPDTAENIIREKILQLHKQNLQLEKSELTKLALSDNGDNINQLQEKIQKINMEIETINKQLEELI
ncbi:MAG: DNA primase [Alphaproteobacteria bacterium]